MDDFVATPHTGFRKGGGGLAFIFACLAIALTAHGGILLVGALWTNPAALTWWQPTRLAWCAGITVVAVGGAVISRRLELRAGGAKVAHILGADPVSLQSTDVRERQLVTVAEELALAAGVAAPTLYILRYESGINALTAGHTSSDAALLVTRGALERLTRDELQGMLAHEFTHLVRGDHAYHLRAAALVYGLLTPFALGWDWLKQCGSWSEDVTAAADLPWYNNNHNFHAYVLLLGIVLGLPLMLIGLPGYVCGRLLQARVARPSKYAADAQARRFTGGDGVVGALKRVGGSLHAGELAHSAAVSFAHMSFAPALSGLATLGISTHPPTLARIRRLQPSFDGQYPAPAILAPTGDPEIAQRAHQTALNRRASPELAASALAAIGQLDHANLALARRQLAALPDTLRAAAEDPAQAPALLYTLLLAAEPTTRAQQLQALTSLAESAHLRACERLSSYTQNLAAQFRLPLLQLALPALRSLVGDSLTRCQACLHALIHADGEVSPFEFALQKVVARQLAPPRPMNRRTDDRLAFGPSELAGDISVLLGAAARLAAPDETAARAAFARGAVNYNGLRPPLALPAPAACTVDALNDALDRFMLSTPPARVRVLEAIATTLAADGRLELEEFELLRALAAALDCPLPPAY
jgi:Zn-dependent protease with chaperone function